MKYLSVSSGIEAASVAWEQLGWEPVAFSEIAQFPSAALAERFGNVQNLDDMTRFEEWPDAAVDVLVGGTPCQSFSVAGLRQGLSDPRGSLMLVFLGIARRYQPTWIVWENVTGVLSSNKGRDFGTFLAGLAELGYGFAYRVLDAQYFGLAQQRRRVFVVGHSRDWRRAAAVLLEPEGRAGNPPARRSSGQAVAGDVAPSLTASGRGVERTGETRGQDPVVAVMAHGQGGAEVVTDGGAPCLTCNHEAPILAHTLRGEGFDASEDGTGRGTPLVTVPVAFAENSRHELRLEGGDGARTGALSTGGGKAGQGLPMIAQTITASARVPQAGGNNPGIVNPVIEDMRVRRLTPRECERLQGFPDDWTLIPWRGKPAEKCPDGPRYKAIGNSMAVPVMRWIGERIAMVEAL